MSFVPFRTRFPDLAEKETRSFTVFNDPVLPSDEYGLVELYCGEPGCDCRRVIFNVYNKKDFDLLAVITYGWESEEFYAGWFGDDDPEIISGLQRPVFNSMSPQSVLAPAIMENVELVLEDGAYIERLKRHYAMFRQEIDQEESPHKRKLKRKKRKRL